MVGGSGIGGGGPQDDLDWKFVQSFGDDNSSDGQHQWQSAGQMDGWTKQQTAGTRRAGARSRTTVIIERRCAAFMLRLGMLAPLLLCPVPGGHARCRRWWMDGF
jgi:hypothetical protein